MTDQPEPCISGRCFSPTACGGFGYCRDRHQYIKDEPTDADRERWKNIAAKMRLAAISSDDVGPRIGDVIEAWPAILPPNAFVQVRADLITAAYLEIEQLRVRLRKKENV